MRLVGLIALAAAAWAFGIFVIWLVSQHPNGVPVLIAIVLVWAVFAVRCGDRYTRDTRQRVP